MAFHVGQKVVCVDATSPPVRGSWRLITKPALGAVYTITFVGVDPSTEIEQVQIAELPTQSEAGLPIFYQATRFRPVQERKQQTDISIFKKLLNPQKVDA